LADEIPEAFAAGSYRIVDQNNDGAITAQNDRVILGRSEPAYRFGVQSNFNWKKLTLRFFINSIQGGKNGYLGVIQEGSQEVSTRLYNHFVGMLDFWSPTNPNGGYASSTAYHVVPIMATKYQSRSFIRLQDVSLAYALKPSVKLFLSGKNVLTFTKWDGWDPETGAGAIIGSFPTMKSYTLGVDISF